MFTILLAATGSRLRAATRYLAVLVAAAAMLGATACGSDSATGPRDEVIAGYYQLQTVDDAQLPAQIHHGPWLDPDDVTFYNLFDARVSNGAIELSEDDDTFWLGIEIDYIGDRMPGLKTYQFFGTYSIENNVIFFHFENGKTGTAVIEDGTIDFQIDVLGIQRYREYRFVLD